MNYKQSLRRTEDLKRSDLKDANERGYKQTKLKLAIFLNPMITNKDSYTLRIRICSFE